MSRFHRDEAAQFCHGFLAGKHVLFFLVNITCPFFLLLASRFPRDGQSTILGSMHESGHAMFAEVVTVTDLVSICFIKLYRTTRHQTIKTLFSLGMSSLHDLC